MQLSEFIRIYPLRAKNLMWFFGAGSSATAGIATATEMLWEFKRAIYCSMEKVSLKSSGDLSNEKVRYKIQSYLQTAVANCPAEGAEDEYSFFFERAYSDDADRRVYIEQKISAGLPSFGHEVLGLLLKHDQVRLIWTTNFDRVIEDVSAKAFGSTAKLVVSHLENPAQALQSINEQRWPVYVKMHGDFQSRRLKNTRDELRNQDIKVRHALIESCKRFGLVVVGYSGRDDSIMETLESALVENAFPAGLYWFRRNSNSTYPRVKKLIEKAKALGISADFVEAESFDELFGDIVTQVPDIPEDSIKNLRAQKPRLSEAPMPLLGSSTSFPVLRLNALPFIEQPQIARLVDCEIGNTKEVQLAVQAVDANVIAMRTRAGVICFGSDTEVRKAFAKYQIKNFDLHQINSEKLKYESAEFGLLYDALLRALVRSRPLLLDSRRGNRMLYVDRTRQNDPAFAQLKSCAQNLSGSKNAAQWAEGIRIKLDYKFDRLWLVFEPSIWISSFELKEFVRDRMAGRFNSFWNALIGAWAEIIAGDESNNELRALGIADGVEAKFIISKQTAFSRKP